MNQDDVSALCGFHGRMLRIDVTTATATWVPLKSDRLRHFLGGVGLGASLLLQENVAERDALAPAAPLLFVFSTLVGSPLTTSAKFAVVSKSPLTDRFNDSLASSRFAISGKRSRWRCDCDCGAGCPAIRIGYR